ncbi:MAG: DNA-directed RNA polymerase subunit H [Candidatus Nanohaloarchaeota archaeon]|nr:DNA-directed RNA polymerase subunit H [Candidatus Nanohaloarchaeota archaeon]
MSNAKKYILDHELVPKHEILSEEEINKLLSDYKISLTQLPKIKASDPVVQLIGAKPGNVLKITRESLTAGISYYYRLVVEDDYVSGLEEEMSGSDSVDSAESNLAESEEDE